MSPFLPLLPSDLSSLLVRRLWLAGALLATLAAGIVTAFSIDISDADAATPAAAAAAAVPISVATVTRSDVVTWAEFSGRMEAVERVDIRSRVAGTVQSVHFREGALVRRGDLLVTIDTAPYAADVERAAAQVAAAQARASFSRSEAERSQRLLDEHAIAQREHDERANSQHEADANLRAALAALQTARLSLDYTQVRAPVSGRVGRIEVTVGNLVAAGPTAPVLTTLVSVDPIYASFDADERVVTQALHDVREPAGHIGARGDVSRIPVQLGTADTTDTPYTGHLQLVDNQVDARSGTVRVRAVFDNADGSLMPGQFARLRLGQVKPGPALLITERAVGTDQSKKYVFVVGADNKAVYREVTLGPQVHGLRIVTSGLKADERVIVNGLQRVRPGALVAPTLVPMDDASASTHDGVPARS